MPSDMPRYTLRIPQILLDKIRFIAAENGRSANLNISFFLMLFHVRFHQL